MKKINSVKEFLEMDDEEVTEVLSQVAIEANEMQNKLITNPKGTTIK